VILDRNVIKCYLWTSYYHNSESCMPQFVQSSRTFVLRHKIKVGLLAGLLLGVIVGLSVFGNEQAPALPEESFPLVEVRAVSELANGDALLPLVGTVKSESEATIQTERSGQIMSVNYALGDRVGAGTVIATIENRSEAAAVAQAQAGLNAAQAQLAQLENELSRSTRTTATDALNTWKSAFAAADDAVNNQTDAFFDNDRGQFPSFLLTTQNDDRIEEQRARVGDLLEVWERELGDVSANENLLPHLAQARSTLSEIQSFLNELSQLVNRTPNSGGSAVVASDADRAALAAARTSINTTLSSTIAIEDEVRQSLPQEGSSEVSRENATRIAAAEASVDQARAGLRAAQANYEKTVIRAPIAGSISFIDLEPGNYVGMSVPVVTVTNPGALEVVTYITEADASLIAPGTEVIISGTARGRVTRMAPTVSPQTKKIEVRIGLTQNSDLTSGESVSIALASAPAAEAAETGAPLTIPLTALKLTTEGAQVFTVEEGVLAAHPVTIDRVLGESVIVKDGLEPHMEIVVDARGLKEGERVTVSTAQALR